MPTGSAILSSGRDSPVARLTLLMKKSAYLQYPSNSRLKRTEAIRRALERPFPWYFSISSPKTYPWVMERSIKARYLGSPQP